jgi:hypothetical protein
MAEPRKWFDQSQPQTLQGAVMLSYLMAVFGLLAILFGPTLGLFGLSLGAAGYGVANERRWGYWLGIVLVGIIVLIYLADLFSVGFSGFLAINLVFMGVLLALFLHPQSREYQRIWFK